MISSFSLNIKGLSRLYLSSNYNSFKLIQVFVEPILSFAYIIFTTAYLVTFFRNNFFFFIF